MEPLSALGVATAVVQFLDFAGKVVAGTYEIYTAKPGAAGTSLEDVTSSLLRVNGDLKKAISSPAALNLSQTDKDIVSLGKRCEDLGTRLISTLAKIHINASSSKCGKLFSSFKAALLTVWKQSEVEALCRDLEGHRSQISLLILVALR